MIKWKVTKSDYSQILFTHPEHGMISVINQNDAYTIRHAGAIASINGISGKGIATLEEAVNHTIRYVKAINSGKLLGKRLYNRKESNK